MLRAIEKHFEPVVIVATLGAIIVLVFADVVARFAFSTSIAVAGELARLSFVYMIYFGVAYAIRERRHMRVTVLLDLAPARLRLALFALAELVFLAYSVVVCWLGIVITEQAIARGKILSATEWPTAVLYAAIVLSAALCVLRLVQSLWTILSKGEAPVIAQRDV
jgi:TRAP-type C4-dicarboxylate transport system permease small subunit